MAKTDSTTTKKNTSEPQIIVPNTVVEITIPWSEAEAPYNNAIKTLAKRMKLKGFRQGSVPAHVAEKTLSQEDIITRALDGMIGKYYTEALKKEGHTPLTQPRLNLKEGKKGSDWVVTAEIATKPELKVSGYKKDVQTAHKEAEKEYDKAQKEAEKAKKEAAKDSKTQDDKSAAPAEPEKTPEQKEQEKRQALLQGVYRSLLDKFQPKVPELLAHQEMQYELEQLVRQLKMFNMELKDYLARRNQTEQDLSVELASSVVPRIQLTFIIDAIADEQKIEIKDADIDEYIEKNATDEVKAKHTQDPQYRQMVADTLTRQKVADYLLAL